MPYKSKEKRRECRRRWYANNKQSEVEHVKRRKKKLKKWFEEYKKKLSCTKCKENHPATIDFHHLRKKKEGVSYMVANGYSIEKIKNEIRKCVVLCANCHRKEYYDNS